MIDLSVEQLLRDSIQKFVEIDSEMKSIIAYSVEIPPTFEYGEKSSNISFKLAKTLKKSPMVIAEEISEEINKRLNKKSIIKTTKALKGYINFFFNLPNFFNLLRAKILEESENFGRHQFGKGKKIIVEHTSINPVKPLHIGNLRNAILGDCVARLYLWNGWEVEIQNLIDDFGRQVATLIWGILKNHHLNVIREVRDTYDVWLGKVYSYCNGLLEKKDEWEEVDKIMMDMRNDPKIYRFMRYICQLCVNSNLETAWRFGINYDYLVWESDISRSGIWEETLHLLEKNKSFSWETDGSNEGCFVAHLSELAEFQDKKNPDKVFIRSNGLPTYVAHDVALQFWKLGLVKAKLKSQSIVKQKNEYGEVRDLWTSIDYDLPTDIEREFGKSDRVCNVIGMEQNYLQEIVRYTLKLLNLNDEFQNSFHMSYKHVNAPHARFSGRTGNWLEERAWADAVFQDTYMSAFKTITKKRPDLEGDPDKREEIVSSITVGAIRYWLTKFSTETEIKFRIKDATSLEGDTGPFLMYSLVRATKILSKSPSKQKTTDLGALEISPQEKRLIMNLAQFPEITKTAAETFQPIIVAKYAFDLAASFNKFYETSRVINAKTKTLRAYRLSLVKSFKIVMQNTLRTLGIPIIDEM